MGSDASQPSSDVSHLRLGAMVPRRLTRGSTSSHSRLRNPDHDHPPDSGFPDSSFPDSVKIYKNKFHYFWSEDPRGPQGKPKNQKVTDIFFGHFFFGHVKF